MLTAPNRIFLGCVAGALAILLFHQPILQVFFWCGLTPHAAFRIAIVPPFNVPLVVSITFWGGIYGALFGWVLPWLRGPLWAKGIAAGTCAMLLTWYVFLPLGGHRMAFGGDTARLLRSGLAWWGWGIGLTWILPLLHPRRLHGRRGRPVSATLAG